MKTNKKLIVSSLASVMAISMVGSIAGTVAWYQYSTRATVSMIGMNVAETGILEISKNGSDWQRDLITSDLVLEGSRTDLEMTPVTFATGADQTATSALTGTAYKNPDVSNRVVKSDGSDYATRGSYASAWDVASAKDDYIQFKLYMRAREVNDVDGGYTQVQKDVYMTDFVLDNIGNGVIAEALRIHLAIDLNGDGDSGDSGEGNFLLSKTAKAAIPLAGNLDQDNDGIADRVGGYEWATHRDDTIVYGATHDDGHGAQVPYTQTTKALSALKAERDSENNHSIATDAEKKLFTTPLSGAACITVTMWIEGWENSTNLQKTGVTKYSFESSTPAAETSVADMYLPYDLNGTPVVNNFVAASGTADGSTVYYTRNSETITVADWSGFHTDGAKFQFGITFDVGRDAFKA